MCVVIDMSAISMVFNRSNSNHYIFKPVYDWIINDNGKMVYGGAEYVKELKGVGRYLNLILELQKGGKVYRLSDEEVDKTDQKIKEQTCSKGCNDTHIIAIIIVSGCRIVCSVDFDSFQYLTCEDFYSRPLKKPKIYSNLSNKTLLQRLNICKTCKLKKVCNISKKKVRRR